MILILLKKKNEWLNSIALIPQQTFLFNTDLIQNITLTDDVIDYKKLNYCLEMSLVSKFSYMDKKNSEIKIDELGNNLSSGQKQRIGIARALYKDPKVLVLDEATNSLDSKNEKRVLENIYNLKRRKTLIIISHNNSVLNKCDRVFEIKDKNLREIIL